MATLHVQKGTTLALSLHDLQWQTQPLQNQRAEMFPVTLNSRPVGAPCNTALVQGPEWRTQVGLVCGAMTGQSPRSPESGTRKWKTRDIAR